MNEHILVLEDDENLRNMLGEILSDKSYKVFSANNVTMAFEIIESGKIPDLIISDIMMPGKSGLDFFREFKERYKSSDIPFIFLTAKADESDVRTGMNLGADDYLKKPFKVADLLRSVELRLHNKDLVNNKLKLFNKSLAVNIPHELRNPLVPILGFSEIILQEYESLSKETINTFVKKIKASGTRLNDRVNKLLLYEELELHDINHEYKLQKLLSASKCSSEQIDSLLYDVMQKYEANNKIRIDCEPATMDISPKHLKIVLCELTDNCMKFSEHMPCLEIKGRIVNGKYLIKVTDNGPGLSGNAINNILLSTDEKTGANYDGSSGFGLLIVQKILNIYDSKLNITNNEKTGLTVSFTLDIEAISRFDSEKHVPNENYAVN